MSSHSSRGRDRFELVVFDVYRDGHRRDYFRVLRHVLGGTVAWGPFSNRWPLLLRARKLVCSTCDDYLGKFFVLAIVRAMLGRPTVGLSIRAETIFQRFGLAQAIKRVLLAVLKHVPKVKFVTFMPWWVEPRLERYSSDWMYDLQYWDLPWLNLPQLQALGGLGADLRQRAASRRVVVSVGHQRRVKGVEYFMQIYCDWPEVREHYLFACIGPNWDVDRALVERFVACGGVFADRVLRDEEIVPTYSMADLVWVCYRPDYDQSSGIFGRAIQLDRLTIARQGSYLATLQERLGAGGFSIPYGLTGEAARALLDCAHQKVRPIRGRPERSASYLCGLTGVSQRVRDLPGKGLPDAPSQVELVRTSFDRSG